MNQIESLTSKVQQLDRAFNRWDKAYIWFAGAAVFVALIAFTLQYISRRPAARLKAAQQDLRAALDAEKDTQIAKANDAAGQANLAAASANERAEKLSGDNIRLKASLAAEVETAKERAEELRQQNLVTANHLTEANAHITAANHEIELEKIKRLQMEEILAPRSLPLRGENGINNYDPLTKFAGMRVKVEYLPDAEVTRATRSVLSILSAAGYRDVNSQPRTDINTGFYDGVLIETYQPAEDLPNFMEMEYAAISTGDAIADTFGSFFQSEKWTSRHTLAKRGELQPNEFRIIVGYKPNPSPEDRAVNEQLAEDMKRIHDHVKVEKKSTDVSPIH